MPYTSVAIMEIYRLELTSNVPLTSAFMTHGLCTFLILCGGWTCFCLAIDLLAARVKVIKASKLQGSKTTANPALRALARRVVIRNWITILLQTVLFAPLLKAVFPLQRHLSEPAMAPQEYATHHTIATTGQGHIACHTVQCTSALDDRTWTLDQVRCLPIGLAREQRRAVHALPHDVP